MRIDSILNTTVWCENSWSRTGGRIGAHLRVRYERKKTSLFINPNTYTSPPTIHNTNRVGNRFSHDSHSHEEPKDSS